jgi:predicted DNA-binding protein (MmcQ/YjbR family)
MDVESAGDYCLQKQETEASFPFADDSFVIKVMGKMFGLIDLKSANKIFLKCDPEHAVELREQYNGIAEAYHVNKKYWNSVSFNELVDDKLIKQLIDHSYVEVLNKLTKKQHAEYDALF